MEVEISKDMTAPKITYGPEAHFSAKARRKKEECTVGINLTVTKEGTTRDMLVTDSCPDLDANAMKDGQPVAVRVTIQVGFTIY
jgi:outer membrane biosynthesis protein TonB